MKFKKGQIVFCLTRGWGQVVDTADYQGVDVLRVEFERDPGQFVMFNLDGRESATDYAPSLISQECAFLVEQILPKEEKLSEEKITWRSDKEFLADISLFISESIAKYLDDNYPLKAK